MEASSAIIKNFVFMPEIIIDLISNSLLYTKRVKNSKNIFSMFSN